MKTKSFLMLTAAVLGLSGCAHGIMRGSVAMKTSDNEAHVCLGKDEVKVGERVVLFRNVCPTKGPGQRYGYAAGICQKKEIGAGTVEGIVNQHYSLVKFDPGVQFEEGTFVEKQIQ